MKSPKNMRIIEIDITNACDKRCSNCTRLCGHHQKPYFMDFETFKRAVDSLDGYQGIRSMMGGEPTLHPEFERFIEYLGSKFPERKNPMVKPQRADKFIEKVQEVEFSNFEEIDEGMPRMDIVGAGMFSNMGATFKKYYEVISDTLPFMGLNDHLNTIYHQSALITRKELGIPDDEWVKLRDKCWLQNEWSAGITPKGCFFCEVAGVLDMLLDGPGGWPIEPGWWKRTPDQFGDQLHWCEFCGFALETFTRDSSEEVDDISPEWYERLKELKSTKLASGRVNVLKIENGEIAEESKRENKHFSSAMPYIEHYGDRFNAQNSVLFTHEYEEAVIPDGQGFGSELNKALSRADEWVVVHSDNVVMQDDFSKQIGRYVLNPGTLHYIDLSSSSDTRFVSNADSEQTGYAALFSKRARSLRSLGFDGVAQLGGFKELVDKWQQEKIVDLSSDFDVDDGLEDKLAGMRLVIWGAGVAGGAAVDVVNKAGGNIVFLADKNECREGEVFHGLKVHRLYELYKFCENSNSYDYLLIANYSQFYDIKDEAISNGIPSSRIWFISDLNKKLYG